MPTENEREEHAGSARSGAAETADGGVAAEIIPLVRTLAQFEAAVGFGASCIYCEFENLRDLAVAVERAAASHTAAATPQVWAVPPRVFKEGEGYLLDAISAAGITGVLVRNHEHLRRFAGSGAAPRARGTAAALRARGDFSLNVANPISASFYKNRYALERLTASYDLNADQLELLLRDAPPAWFEVTLHQRMPMFHMEHCVFCAFLTSGRDFRDCGRPCEKRVVRLRDRTGMEHAVLADAACRNTVFNGRAQTGAEFATRLLALGVRHFRIEFLDEPPEQIPAVLARYAALLRGEISGTALWHDLKLHSQLGVTRGTLQNR
jgi:putative protease